MEDRDNLHKMKQTVQNCMSDIFVTNTRSLGQPTTIFSVACSIPCSPSLVPVPGLPLLLWSPIFLSYLSLKN